MMISVCKNCNKPILNPVDNCFCWWREQVVNFIEEEYPKGTKDRGKVTVMITLFILWLEKNKELKVAKDK